MASHLSKRSLWKIWEAKIKQKSLLSDAPWLDVAADKDKSACPFSPILCVQLFFGGCLVALATRCDVGRITRCLMWTQRDSSFSLNSLPASPLHSSFDGSMCLASRWMTGNYCLFVFLPSVIYCCLMSFSKRMTSLCCSFLGKEIQEGLSLTVLSFSWCQLECPGLEDPRSRLHHSLSYPVPWAPWLLFICMTSLLLRTLHVTWASQNMALSSCSLFT